MGKEEIEKLASLCLKYNVILVSDEVHSEITFEKKHASTSSDTSITLYFKPKTC
ncbi:Uncharacterised protein [Streptobacillus moniliformis]|nr:Uncharacterised protein [Streptobacillus moniliformis]